METRLKPLWDERKGSPDVPAAVPAQGTCAVNPAGSIQRPPEGWAFLECVDQNSSQQV